jgi:hypothetical protein
MEAWNIRKKEPVNNPESDYSGLSGGSFQLIAEGTLISCCFIIITDFLPVN